LIESRKTFSELHEARIVSQQTPSDIGSSTKIIAVTRSAVKNVNVVWHKEKGLMKKGLKLFSSNPFQVARGGLEPPNFPILIGTL